MRVLVTGSRTWSDGAFLREALRRITDELIDAEPDRYLKEGITIVTGACRSGADRLAEKFAEEVFAFDIERHPADWRRGRQAGFDRNHKMVDLGLDVCVAFIMRCSKPSCPQRGLHGSHGSTDCADYAESQGYRVERFDRALLDPRSAR